MPWGVLHVFVPEARGLVHHLPEGDILFSFVGVILQLWEPVGQFGIEWRNKAFIDGNADEEAAHAFCEGLVVEDVFGFCVIEMFVVFDRVVYGDGEAEEARISIKVESVDRCGAFLGGQM